MCLDVRLEMVTQVCVVLYQSGEVLRGYSDELVCFVWIGAIWKRWESESPCACVCP